MLMATVEFIKKRITGKENEIAKLEKKLERIHQAEATNWEKNPYYYSERDINYTVKEIEATKKQLEAYQIQLQAAEEKNASRDVKPILDFLADWKHRAFEYYRAGLAEYYTEYQQLLDESDQYASMQKMPASKKDYFKLMEVENQLIQHRKSFDEARKGKWEEIPKNDPSYRKWYNDKRKVAEGKYEWLKEFFCYRTLEESLASLEKQLNREAELKYDDIINRTNKIVGQITDATNLSIGLKGDLNGFIVGTRGKASVNTIGAGGWNIQVYHFRTLIKPYTE